MATVDSLDIQIKASADSADKALNRLVGTIGRISASLGGVNFTGFATGARNLATAMQGLQNVKMPDYNRLAKGIQQIGSINSAQIQQAGVAIKELSGSLRYLDSINVSDNSKQIAELAKGISKLGSASAVKATANIPQLATAMKNLMATLSTAPTVSQNVINMTNALANLSRTGASSGRAANALGKSLNTYSTSANRARKSTFSLASAFGKMYASYFLLFRLFGKIGDAIDISSSLTEVQNVVDVTFGNMSSAVEDFTKNSIEQFGMSELSAKKFASTFQAMGSAMGIDSSAIESANTYLNGVTKGYVGLSDSMADVSLNLTKLTADMASFYNVDQKYVAEDLTAIFTGQTRPMRQYGIDLTQATLQEWALKQGLDANIQSMTQAEKTMLRYQYVMANTGAAQGDFARTADTWANQIRILKQNFEQLGAVIGGTFINMLKPLVKALNNAMSHIIAFAETVSNALGKIFGWKYEVGGGGVASDMEDGAGYADDIAGGLDDAQKNAKKLKDYVLGIDELNIISPDTGDTGATGGGAGGAGGGAGASGGQWVKQESIFADYESEIDSLYKLGEYIRDALIGAMESIDWDAVYEKANGFGKGLAEFLNGLISPELFGAVGKTIAGSLNTALHFLNSFGQEFEWYEFGDSLAETWRSFFETWDAGLTGETLSNFASGLLESLSVAIDGLAGNDTFTEIGQKLVDFICGIEWGTIVWDLAGFIQSLSNAVVELPVDLMEGIAQGIADKIFGEGEVEIDLDWLTDALQMISPTASPIAKILNIKEWWEESGQQDFEEIINYITENWFNSDDVQKITSFFVLLWENIKSIWSTVFAWFGTNVIEPVVSLLAGFSTRAWQIFEGIWIIIQATWAIVSDWFNEYVITPLVDFFSPIVETIGTFFSDLWEDIKTVWKKASEWFDEHVAQPVMKVWKTATEKIGEFFSGLWDGIKSGVVGAMNAVIGGIESAINFIVGGINTIISGFNDVVEWASKVAGISWGGVTLIPNVSLPRIEGYFNGGYPESGSLFWAGENNIPEIVGTVGGRTAVASGVEITGIADAVYSTGQEEASLLSTAVNLLHIIAEKEMSVNIGDVEIAEANMRGVNRMGYSFG